MMTTFLNIVRQATAELGKAPYDDKKTMEYALEASRRTVELCDQLRTEKHQMEMGELESKVKEFEQNRPPMGKYGRAALRHIQTLDRYRYFQLLISENLFERILVREEQAQTMLRTIIDHSLNGRAVLRTARYNYLLKQYNCNERFLTKARNLLSR